jgi:spermidine synthase
MLALFVGSGCAALIYEIVWLQMLQLVIGGNTQALGVLLGTFMGGMCLGSLLLPRLIPSAAHPLRVYAYLELGIAVCAILILYTMPSIEHLYTVFGQHKYLRLVVAAICLLPPTVLMGATLPAVARWVESTPRGVSWLGFFYGGNIVGAVLGCLLAGFYLLRVFDMGFATWCAVAINLAVAGLAFALSAFAEYAAPSVDSLKKGSVDWAQGAWPVYAVTCISGMCALGAEVVWTRLLSLQFGGTVYTFSIILGVFLMGLGIGSSIASMVARTITSPRLALGACQLLLTLAIFWTAYMISCSMPFWPVSPDLVSTHRESQWYTFQLDIARTIWAILPAACLWGASFPLALAAAAGPGKEPGRLVGGLYAINTVGAIVGSLAVSLWLIQALGVQDAQALAELSAKKALYLGTQNVQRILIGLSLISALIAWLPLGWGIAGSAAANSTSVARSDRSPAEPFAWWVAAAAVCVIPAYAMIQSVKPIPWGLAAEGRYMASKGDELALADGILGDKDPPAWHDSPDEVDPEEYCLYMGEGVNVTVAVTASNRYHTRSFHGGGKVQASTDPADMRLQRMLGHIPALIHPNPKSVLVVACGAGVTAGSFIPHPEVEEIVICDIEPLVPNVVTPFFSNANFNVVGRYVDGQVTDKKFIDSGRVTVEIDDGRHYIRTLPPEKKFDIITSDPIDPWVKGCAALNTVEYYQMCKDHLEPGGVMALWMPIYESNEVTLKSVIGTFFEVFPNGILWTNDVGKKGYDAILFGQVEPTRINLDELQERLDRPDQKPVKDSMRDVGFNSIYELLGTYAGDAPRMKEWTKGAQINTDRNLRLQYLAGLSLNYYIEKQLLEGILKHYSFPVDIFSGSDENIKKLQAELESNGRN